MRPMEFTYRLTEEDYLRAAKIKAKNTSTRPWSRFLSRIYLGLFFLVLWFSMIVGRILEWLDLTGDKLGHLSVASVLFSSILPTAILSFLVILLIRAVLFWPKLLRRREQFRNSVGCQVETIVNVSPERIAFRSETGSSESQWRSYAAWSTRDGILVLDTQAGVRQILKIAGLSQDQRSELLGILRTTLGVGVIG